MFTWTGNKDLISDEDITEIVADMWASRLILTHADVVKHLGRIDPEGTLNISAAELYERAKGLVAL